MTAKSIIANASREEGRRETRQTTAKMAAFKENASETLEGEREEEREEEREKKRGSMIRVCGREAGGEIMFITCNRSQIRMQHVA